MMNLENYNSYTADDPEDVLEKNAFEIFADPKHAKIPESIGGYKIVREIGRGGMGAVYEAVRASTTKISSKSSR